jgi:hypothetical protein
LGLFFALPFVKDNLLIDGLVLVVEIIEDFFSVLQGHLLDYDGVSQFWELLLQRVCDDSVLSGEFP